MFEYAGAVTEENKYEVSDDLDASMALWNEPPQPPRAFESMDWHHCNLNDLTYEIKPLPGFDAKEFPYVVGLNNDCTELILANVVSQRTTRIVHLVKKSGFDRIADVQTSYQKQTDSICIHFQTAQINDSSFSKPAISYMNTLTLDADMHKYLRKTEGRFIDSVSQVRRLVVENEHNTRTIQDLTSKVKQL